MAKILVSFRTGLINKKAVIGPYYDGLFRSLVRNGNEVLYFNGSEFLQDSWNGENTLRKSISPEKVEHKIKEFAPDLVITFNNTTYKTLHKLVDCPICIWDADLPYYFSDKKTINENVDRFHFFCFSEHSTHLPEEAFSAKKSRIFHVPTATDFYPEQLECRQNISFIGTNFKFNMPAELLTELIQNPLKLAAFQKVRAEYQKDYNASWEEVLQKHNIPPSYFSGFNVQHFRNAITGRERAQILNELVPCGLRLYGNIYTDWLDVAEYFLDLALCYDIRDVTDLLSNQEIYNTSKIGVSISHPQSVTGFPFRVADIMATNACIVSDARPDKFNMFAKHLKLPMYETKYEAYRICNDLLKDEKKRQEIVTRSQQVINEHFRFENQFEKLEQILGVRLVGLEKPGRYEKMSPSEFLLPRAKISLKQNLKKRIKKAIKSFLA